MTAWHSKYMNNLFGAVQGKPDFSIQKFWIANEVLERLNRLRALSDIRLSRFDKPWSVYFPKEPAWIQAKPSRWMWLVEPRIAPS